MKKRCFVICPNPSVDIIAKISALEAGVTNRISTEKSYPGGKGIHVAMALAELDIPVTLFGIWGEENGDLIKRSCKHFYPDIEIGGPIVKGYNRSCYTFQSDSIWNETELLGPGPLMTDEDFDQLFDLVLHRIDEAASLAICGSWPIGANEMNNFRLNELAKMHELPLFLDCTGEQLLNVLNGRPYCVHLNHRELTDIYGQNFDKAMTQLSTTCKLLLITKGAEGLFYLKDNFLLHANVKLETVINTVGSGDCLLAGIIAGHYLSYNDKAIAKLGVACGAANCIYPDLGMIQKSDVNRLVDNIELVEKKLAPVVV